MNRPWTALAHLIAWFALMVIGWLILFAIGLAVEGLASSWWTLVVVGVVVLIGTWVEVLT